MTAGLIALVLTDEVMAFTTIRPRRPPVYLRQPKQTCVPHLAWRKRNAEVQAPVDEPHRFVTHRGLYAQTTIEVTVLVRRAQSGRGFVP